MEGGVYGLVHKIKCCAKDAKCAMCNAVTEQIEQDGMRKLLTPQVTKNRKGPAIGLHFILSFTFYKLLASRNELVQQAVGRLPKKAPQLCLQSQHGLHMDEKGQGDLYVQCPTWNVDGQIGEYRR
jgi:hypothetical protein